MTWRKCPQCGDKFVGPKGGPAILCPPCESSAPSRQPYRHGGVIRLTTSEIAALFREYESMSTKQKPKSTPATIHKAIEDCKKPNPNHKPKEKFKRRKQVPYREVGWMHKRHIFLYIDANGDHAFRVVSKGNNKITCVGEGYKNRSDLLVELNYLWPDGTDPDRTSINDR